MGQEPPDYSWFTKKRIEALAAHKVEDEIEELILEREAAERLLIDENLPKQEIETRAKRRLAESRDSQYQNLNLSGNPESISSDNKQVKEIEKELREQYIRDNPELESYVEQKLESMSREDRRAKLEEVRERDLNFNPQKILEEKREEIVERSTRRVRSMNSGRVEKLASESDLERGSEKHLNFLVLYLTAEKRIREELEKEDPLTLEEVVKKENEEVERLGAQYKGELRITPEMAVRLGRKLVELEKEQFRLKQKVVLYFKSINDEIERRQKTSDRESGAGGFGSGIDGAFRPLEIVLERFRVATEEPVFESLEESDETEDPIQKDEHKDIRQVVRTSKKDESDNNSDEEREAVSLSTVETILDEDGFKGYATKCVKVADMCRKFNDLAKVKTISENLIKINRATYRHTSIRS